MSFLIHCTLLLSALIVSLPFCIRASAASASPAAMSPAPPVACPHPCSSLPSLSTLSPNFTFDNTSSVFNPMPFNTSSVFYLSINLSSSSTFTMDFTVDFTDAESEDCPAILAFTQFPSPRPFMELNFLNLDFHDSRREPPTAGVCKSEELERHLAPTTSACPGPAADPHSFDSEETHFNYAVSLTIYYADSAEFHVQAVVNHPFECNQTFILLNTTGLQPDADSISLLVGYFTTRKTFIGITGFAPAHENNSNNSKSNHNIKVVVWVVVGVSMLAFLVGLIILALSIKKHRRRPPLITSRPPGHVVPPSTTTRAPFPHRHLESSATPMMMALPPSPPYHTNDFQISGTASWLKQANPR